MIKNYCPRALRVRESHTFVLLSEANICPSLFVLLFLFLPSLGRHGLRSACACCARLPKHTRVGCKRTARGVVLLPRNGEKVWWDHSITHGDLPAPKLSDFHKTMLMICSGPWLLDFAVNL